MPSNDGTIDEVTMTCVVGAVRVTCTRAGGSRLILHCCSAGDVAPTSSLTLQLPNETLDKVLSAGLVPAATRLLVRVLTVSGILIVLDLTRFLVDGHLPYVGPVVSLSRDPVVRAAAATGALDTDQTVTLATAVEDLGGLAQEQEGCLPLCVAAGAGDGGRLCLGCLYGYVLVHDPQAAASNGGTSGDAANPRWRLVRCCDGDVLAAAVVGDVAYLQTARGLLAYYMDSYDAPAAALSSIGEEPVGEVAADGSAVEAEAGVEVAADTAAEAADDEEGGDADIWRECDSESDDDAAAEDDEADASAPPPPPSSNGIFVDLWALRFFQTGKGARTPTKRRRERQVRRLRVAEAAAGTVLRLLSPTHDGVDVGGIVAPRGDRADAATVTFVSSVTARAAALLLAAPAAHGQAGGDGVDLGRERRGGEGVCEGHLGAAAHGRAGAVRAVDPHAAAVLAGPGGAALAVAAALDRPAGALLLYLVPPPPGAGKGGHGHGHGHGHGNGSYARAVEARSVGETITAYPPLALPLPPCAAVDLRWLLQLQVQVQVPAGGRVEAVVDAVFVGDSLVVATNTVDVSGGDGVGAVGGDGVVYICRLGGPEGLAVARRVALGAGPAARVVSLTPAHPTHEVVVATASAVHTLPAGAPPAPAPATPALQALAHTYLARYRTSLARADATTLASLDAPAALQLYLASREAFFRHEVGAGTGPPGCVEPQLAQEARSVARRRASRAPPTCPRPPAPAHLPPPTCPRPPAPA